MVIPYLRIICLVMLAASFAAEAEIYKWVDDNGQVHYSQTPPENQSAQTVPVPPPPSVNPDKAQQAIDQLIQEQKESDMMREQEQQRLQQEQQQEESRQKNCDSAKQNLQTYQNNPGRRFIDAEGNVTRLPEEERQQKIEEMQKKVNEYCQ